MKMDFPVIGEPLPLFECIEIETTNTCTRKCWFCLHGQLEKPRPRAIMSWEMIVKIIEELRELNYDSVLFWYSTNEPLLDKRIVDIIKLSRQRLNPNVRLPITTNGDLLTQPLLDNLFAAGMTKLNISLYDLESDKALDRLDFKNYNVLFWKYYVGDGYNRKYELDLDPEEDFDNRAGKIVQLTTRKYENWNCWRPFRFMAIRFDGKMKLCSKDTDASGIPDHCTLEKMTLKELWYSKEMDEYRAFLRHGRTGKSPCRECSYRFRCSPCPQQPKFL